MRTGLFNIGVSGQMLAAGFLATILVGYSGLNAFLAKPLVLLIGVAAGAVVGGLIGLLKYKFNINEVVSSIMLNYIIQYVCSFCINTFYVDPVSRQSKAVAQSARLTLADTVVGDLKMDIPPRIYPCPDSRSPGEIPAGQDKNGLRNESSGLLPQRVPLCGDQCG